MAPAAFQTPDSRILNSTWSKPAPATGGCRRTSCAPRARAIADFYDAVRLHLVEASAAARAAQPATLGDVGERLAASSDALPASFEGVLIANELLDAFPVHQVVMREDGLREVYVVADSAVRPELRV